MRRIIRAIGPAVLLAGLIGSSVHAYGITPTLKVNGSDSGVSVKVGNTATGKGTATYDSNVGPIPIPVTYYVVHTVPWWPFATPQYVGGNTGAGTLDRHQRRREQGLCLQQERNGPGRLDDLHERVGQVGLRHGLRAVVDPWHRFGPWGRCERRTSP